MRSERWCFSLWTAVCSSLASTFLPRFLGCRRANVPRRIAAPGSTCLNPRQTLTRSYGMTLVAGFVPCRSRSAFLPAPPSGLDVRGLIGTGGTRAPGVVPAAGAWVGMLQARHGSSPAPVPSPRQGGPLKCMGGVLKGLKWKSCENMA